MVNELDSKVNPTSSFSSLTARAAAESAGVISTSSTSLDISSKAFFHSSIKGPTEVSFAIVPTFFCNKISQKQWGPTLGNLLLLL